MFPRQVVGWRLGSGALAAALVWPVAADHGPALHQTTDRIPQIELKAPGVFDDRARPAVAENALRYQVNATVLIPLLVASIPLVSRDNVGFGSAAARDFRAADGGWLRTYEFFAASISEQARGMNRMGFLREAVRLGADGNEWTVHFGVVSSNREETRDEAERNLDRDESIQPYSILDGFTDRAQTSNASVQLDLEGRWESSDDLYAELRPQWEAAEPDEETILENRDGRLYAEPLGFLGGLQWSLQTAAADVSRGEEPSKYRYPFVHNGKVFYLEVRGHAVDDRRQRRYAEAGLMASDAVLHRFNFRILDDKRDTWAVASRSSSARSGDAA